MQKVKTMAMVLDIIFKVTVSIFSIIKFLFGLLCIVAHSVVWLVNLIVKQAQTSGTESSLPLISEDNSEVSDIEDATEKMEIPNLKQTLQNKPRPQEMMKTPTLKIESALRKRTVQSNNGISNCQVCGVKPPTMHCRGPRCYDFFCSDCNIVYHKHPRRERHVRSDISSYTPITETFAEYHQAVKDIPARPQPQISSLNSVQTSFQTDLACSADYNMSDEIPVESPPNTWQCETCTFVNPNSTKVCKMCFKTNSPLLNDTSQVILVDETLADDASVSKTPTKLTEPCDNDESANFNKDRALYDSFWFKNQPPTQTIATAEGRGISDNNTIETAPKKIDEEENASGFATTWCCIFCTFENKFSTGNICEVCSKSNILLDENRKSEEREEDPFADNGKLDVASKSQTDTATDIAALKFMQKHHIENYDIAALTSKLVDMNFKLQDAIEAAKRSSNLDDAVSFLQQECPLCEKTCNTRDMIAMVYCTHRCCENCTRRHFSRQIRNNDLTSCACPVCFLPSTKQIVDFDENKVEYFLNLSLMLKSIIDADDFLIYQTKLRDWISRRHPDFHLCPNCPYGFTADDGENRFACPECHVTSCHKCKKIWQNEHVGKTCDDFSHWEQAPKHKNKKNKKNKKAGDNPNVDPKKWSMKNFIPSFSTTAKSATDSSNTNNTSSLPQQREEPSYAAVTNSQSPHPTNQKSKKSQYTPNKTHDQGTKQTQNTIPNNTTNNSNNNTAPTPSSYNVERKKEVPITRWECPHCTLLNEAGVSICESCAKSYGTIVITEDINLVTSSNSSVLHNTFDNNNDSFKRPNLRNSEAFPQTKGNGGSGVNFYNDVAATLNSISMSEAIANASIEAIKPPIETPMEVDNSPSTKLDVCGTTSGIDPNTNQFYEHFEKNESSDRFSNDHRSANTSTSTDMNFLSNKELQLLKEIEYTKKWDLAKEAVNQNFSVDEIFIAFLHCGSENPIVWLEKNWYYKMSTVKLSAELELIKMISSDLMNICPITDIVLRNALVKHNANTDEATAECIEGCLRKIHAGASGNERIVSHRELQSSNIAPPPGFLINPLPESLVFQPHFTRIDSALSIMTQSSRIAASQNQARYTNLTPTNYTSVDPSFRNPNNSGVHQARPATADYEKNDVD